MRPRFVLPQILILGFLSLAISVASASAAGQSPLRSAAATETVSSAATVLRAFHAVKINLVRRTAGNSSQPVTVLSGAVPRKITHTRSWTVAVFVYRDPSAARLAFDTGIAGWRANGFAATRADNLIVTVVPQGQMIGAHGKPFAMPQLVLDALRGLTHKSR